MPIYLHDDKLINIYHGFRFIWWHADISSLSIYLYEDVVISVSYDEVDLYNEMFIFETCVFANVMPCWYLYYA